MISFSLLGMPNSLSIMLYALYPLTIVILLCVAIRAAKKNGGFRRNKKRSSNAKQTQPQQEAPLDIGPLVRKNMTADEKKCFDYFFAESKGGCLQKLTKKALSDDDYDKMVADKLNEHSSKIEALKKIGMDISQVSEIEPIRFHGFEKYANRLHDGYASKVGADGRSRSSVCSVTWLFFGDSEMFVYHGRFDMLTASKVETMNEYFYKDITNFATVTDTEQNTKLNVRAAGCRGNKIKEDVEKSFVDYETFRLTIDGRSFTCSVSGVSNAAQTVQGMKQKLREKKAV